MAGELIPGNESNIGLITAYTQTLSNWTGGSSNTTVLTKVQDLPVITKPAYYTDLIIRLGIVNIQTDDPIFCNNMVSFFVYPEFSIDVDEPIKPLSTNRLQIYGASPTFAGPGPFSIGLAQILSFHGPNAQYLYDGLLGVPAPYSGLNAWRGDSQQTSRIPAGATGLILVKESILPERFKYYVQFETTGNFINSTNANLDTKVEVFGVNKT